MKEMANRLYQKQNKIFVCLRYVLETVLILIWTVYLCLHTDSLPSIYILCAACSICFLFLMRRRKSYRFPRSRFLFPSLAALFGIAVNAANYQIITSAPLFLLLWAGGFCVAEICLNGFYSLAEDDRIKYGNNRPVPTKRAVRRLFISCFVMICAIDLIYLVLFRYPGCMNTDGIIQVTNGLYDIRANHFPYVHTLMLLAFLKAGLWLSGGLNLGIAFYCCFQILFMAFCFSWAAATLYQRGMHRLGVAAVIICYVFMPYNIAYSCMVCVNTGPS